MSNEFLPIAAAPASNALAALSNAAPADIDFYGKALFRGFGGDKIVIQEFEKVRAGLRPSAFKLLDILTLKLTENNHFGANSDKIKRVVTVCLNELLESLGKAVTRSNKDKMRRCVKQDLELLRCLSVTVRGKADNSVLTVNLCSAAGYKGGRAFFSFTPEFASVLINGYIMKYPTALLRLDCRNSLTFVLGRFLAERASNTQNIRRGCNDIVGVKSVCERCNISVNNARRGNGDRHISRATVERVQSALNALISGGVLSEWTYAHEKKMPLRDDEKTLIESGCDFEFWSSLYIVFALKSCPQK